MTDTAVRTVLTQDSTIQVSSLEIDHANWMQMVNWSGFNKWVDEVIDGAWVARPLLVLKICHLLFTHQTQVRMDLRHLVHRLISTFIRCKPPNVIICLTFLSR